MKKFLVCLAVLVSVGQTFSDPASFVTRTGLQAMESALQIRTQNIASQNVGIFPAVEFLDRLNTFSKAIANLVPRLSERLYFALITAEITPLQSMDSPIRILVNYANSLIDLEIMRDKMEAHELKETLQKSAVPVTQNLPPKASEEDNLLTSSS